MKNILRVLVVIATLLVVSASACPGAGQPPPCSKPECTCMVVPDGNGHMIRVCTWTCR